MSQACTYEARHGHRMTEVIWKLWVQMQRQGRSAPLSLFEKIPRLLISDLQKGKLLKNLVAHRNCNEPKQKSCLAAPYIAHEQQWGNRCEQGDAVRGGREKSCGTLDTVRFWRLAIRSTVVLLWMSCVVLRYWKSNWESTCLQPYGL